MPLLGLAVSVGVRAVEQSTGPSPPVNVLLGGVVGILLLGGVGLAIAALSGIPRHGPRGILGKSIAGLVLNGVFLCLFAVGVLAGLNRGVKSRQATEDIHKATRDLQADIRHSFDSEHGITNIDPSKLDRLQSELTNAARNLSGDDALIMKAMAAHTARMQTALRKYEAVANELKSAEVLRANNLTNKTQFAPRREIVSRFLAANDQLKQVIETGEQDLENDLVRLRVAPNKAEATLAGYRSKAGPRNVLIRQIRDCDQRVGQSMIGMLDVLEAQWTNWDLDPATQKIRFQNAAARTAYNKYFEEIQAASTEQIKTQEKLVNLPP